MNIDVEVINSDTEKEVWSFWLNDGVLRLSSYCVFSRWSKRHKFRQTDNYSRMFHRSCTLKIEDVPLPQSVIDQVKQKLISSLIVTK